MARPRKPAHVRKWRGQWYLIWSDQGTERRHSCESLKKFNEEERKDLVNEYRRREDMDHATALQRGGKLAFNTLLIDGLDKFLTHVEDAAKTRMENPDSREGISKKTRKEYRADVVRFKDWLKEHGHSRLTTGDLDATILTQYLGHLAHGRILNDGRTFKLRGASLNKIRRSLKRAVNNLHTIRPPLFPDIDLLRMALKPVRVSPPTPRAFSPDELCDFLSCALEYDRQGKSVAVTRRRRGKREKFNQPVRLPGTPVHQLYLLLALTGMRLGEALKLRWTNVDINRARLTIHASKTGQTRILPLRGAPEGEVAPTLVNLLKEWRRQRPKDDFVLAHKGILEPAYPKKAWLEVTKKAKCRDMSPQRLRQNFTSYAASLGIPSAVESIWVGHSGTVAEKFYRAQVLERHAATSLEAAMGLDKPLHKMLETSA